MADTTTDLDAQWIVEVPPLRARREDIPHLVRHLAGRAGARGRPLSLPHAEALLLHAWPLRSPRLPSRWAHWATALITYSTGRPKLQPSS